MPSAWTVVPVTETSTPEYWSHSGCRKQTRGTMAGSQGTGTLLIVHGMLMQYPLGSSSNELHGTTLQKQFQTALVVM